MIQPIRRRVLFTDTILYDGTNAQQIVDAANVGGPYGFVLVDRSDLGPGIIQIQDPVNDPGCTNCMPMAPGDDVFLSGSSGSIAGGSQPNTMTPLLSLTFPDDWESTPRLEALSQRIDELTTFVSTLADIVTGS